MKQTPNSILQGLAGDLAAPYMILKMELPSVTLFLTDLPYDVVIDGDNYLSDGGLTRFSPPQLTNLADREIYRIELLDFHNELKSDFDNGAVGTDVTVSLGLEGNLVDLDILYKGRIDIVKVITDAAEGTKNAVIECSSPFGALDRTNERLSDSQTQKIIDPADTCFDNVYNNTDEISIGWGKK